MEIESPRGQTIPTQGARNLAFSVFFVLGLGTTFSAPAVLFQQAPYFQLITPEAVCISTFMNTAVCSGLIVTLVYLWCSKTFSEPPIHVIIPVILCMGSLSLFLAANTYKYTAGGVSVALLFACFTGGATGSLSAVVVNPFLTKYRRALISACRSGGSFLILASGLLASIQKPDSKHAVFTTKTYLSIFGCILILPLIAFYFINTAQAGLLKGVEEEAADLLQKEGANGMVETMHLLQEEGGRIGRSSPTSMVLLEIAGSPTRSDHIRNDALEQDDQATPSRTRSRSQHLISVERALYSPMSPTRRLQGTGSSTNRFQFPEVHEAKDQSGYGSVSAAPEPLEALKDVIELATQAEEELVPMIAPLCWLPFVPQQIPAWVAKTIPRAAVVGWCSFNSWGMLSALMPVAMANVSPPDPEEAGKYFAFASQLAAAGIVLGDLSTLFFRLPPQIGACVFTMFSLVMMHAVFTPDMYYRGSMAPEALVCCFVLLRWLGAHLTTSSYRAVAHEIAESHNGLAARYVGTTEQVSVSLGCAVSTAIVLLNDSCRSN